MRAFLLAFVNYLLQMQRCQNLLEHFKDFKRCSFQFHLA